MRKEDLWLELYMDYLSEQDEIKNPSKYIVQNEELDELAEENLIKLRNQALKILAQKKQLSFRDILEKNYEKALSIAEELLRNEKFKIEDFIKQENIAVSYKNFAELSEVEVKDILINHLVLKLEAEKKKSNENADNES
ncbi:MAG: hypothetical protein O9282_02665 [Flavobacterium sp.]|jgi:ABC-type lipoprotein export system ATPase subunit|uniref:hypothetical protein n=1 Tax=Flavobacterium sp. TaxID=239 RepID=UPI0022C41071|nr:hypothetical protein [Flavobacterium sp.]MCZ8023746.1 hypothetical protein [Cytophagales bacterium]MCZ8330196.1 hypothetical protein [Flavobacterium sp.]